MSHSRRCDMLVLSVTGQMTRVGRNNNNYMQPPTHIKKATVWASTCDAKLELWSHEHSSSGSVSLSVLPSLSFPAISFHRLHNIRCKQSEAAVPLFARASLGCPRPCYTPPLSPPAVTMAMAGERWVKYHLTPPDPRLSQGKQWNVTSLLEDTGAACWEQSHRLGQVVFLTRDGGGNAKCSFTFRIKVDHSVCLIPVSRNKRLRTSWYIKHLVRKMNQGL